MPKFRALNPSKMTRQQLDALYAECERVTPDTPSRPLSKAAVAMHQRSVRKAGRPPVGQGAQRINVTVERALLRQVDEYAKSHQMTRAAVIAQGLKQLVAA